MDSILWVDPGEHTGWAMWDGDKKFTSGQGTRLISGITLEVLIRDQVPALKVGWESYLILPGSKVKQDGSALKMIGVLEHLRANYSFAVIKPKPSSSRKVGLQHLQVVGWYRKGNKHANDAAAHLLSYVMTYNLLPSELLQKIADKVVSDFGQS